jgi:hypothetical protein
MPEALPESSDAMDTRTREIARLAETACREGLDEEYAALARRAVETLAQTHPTLFDRGQPRGWACGVVYALGKLNFLFDPSQTPHLKSAEVCALCGVSPATGSARAQEVLAALDTFPFDPAWQLPSRQDDNPLLRMADLLGGLPGGSAPVSFRVVSADEAARITAAASGDRPARTPKARTRRGAGGRLSRIYTLRVELAGSDPLVWRRMAVEGSTPLSDLHVVLQVGMGWEGTHLYAFEADAGRFAAFEPDADERPVEGYTLADLVARPGDVFLYEYDFGDGWEHVVTVEAVGPRARTLTYPVCLGGEEACPPEDSGGIHAYNEARAAWTDPAHPEHALLVGWLGYPFDPSRFDPNFVNRLLRQP